LSSWTRADLIVAVYRHQVEACAEAGPILLAECDTPHHALARWIGTFVDFLVTKHGPAEVLGSDDAAFQTLHAYFIDRLVPVCAQLLEATAAAGEIRPGLDAYELLRGVGNLCVAAGSDLATTLVTWSNFSSRDCASSRDPRFPSNHGGVDLCCRVGV
jgi:hypothetical protein